MDDATRIRSDAQQDDFLAVIADAIGAPLGGLDALWRIDAAEEPEAFARMLAYVRAAAEEVDDLVRRGQAFARWCAGPVGDGDTDLAGVAHAVIASLPEVDTWRAEISCELLPPCRVAVDRDAVTFAVDVLVRNGLRHGGSQPRIDIRIELDDEAARLVVRDRGRGLSADALEAVFRPRVDDQGRPRTSLALARAIAEGHRGSLEARSDGLGRGARFELTLPRLGLSASSSAD